MSIGERKAALFLAALPMKERQALLSKLPSDASSRLRLWIDQLLAMNLNLDGIAQELLAEDVCGLTESTSPAVDEIIAMSKHLPAAWLARMLVAWGGVDRNFVLELLDTSVAADVRAELGRIGAMSPKLLGALRSEALALVRDGDPACSR